MLLQNTKNTPSFAPTSVLYNGLRASTHWLYSTTWIDFCLFIALKVQLMLFTKHFFVLGLYDGLRIRRWLSWISFQLTEPCLMCFAQAGTAFFRLRHAVFMFFYTIGTKLLTTCNPCIPFRLFKATLQLLGSVTVAQST